MAVPLEVITGAAGLAMGAAGTWVAVSTMLERRQPIVVAHEDSSRSMSRDKGSWYVLAHISNEGGPTAFNVRFGVEYAGVRFPYKRDVDDPDAGNVQRVVQPGARLPATKGESFPIVLASEDIWHTAAVRGGLDDSAAYWCRYENARGQTWETTNPGDRSAKLDIRRVRRPKHLRRARSRDGTQCERLVGTGKQALEERSRQPQESSP